MSDRLLGLFIHDTHQAVLTRCSSVFRQK